MPERKKIAAIVTEYFAGSHADVIVSKFIHGFATDQGLAAPRVDIASLYIDQVSDADIGRATAEAHGIPIYVSIVKALTLGGSDLAVDGVLLIGEHGDYAWNEKEQQLFPRKYFMEQICGIIARSGRGIPIFVDKHLSYNWHDACWMMDRAAALGAPLMAGSSLPVAWRNPWLEHERETPIDAAVAVGFSGLDSYGFHTLEVLQCKVERRAGGESGVAAVTCLEGDAVWRGGDDGMWSRDLAEAACAAIQDKPAGRMEEHCENPVAMLVEYRDGLCACVLMLNGYVHDLAYAARASGETVAAEFFAQGHGGTDGAFGHFSYLALNVEEMFVTGVPVYPAQRTLLVTGILEAALTSRHERGRRLETPWLDVAYQAPEDVPWRPRGPRPAGACLTWTKPSV